MSKNRATSDLSQISASQAVALIAERRLSSVELVTACLRRIEERELSVKAWSYLDPEMALDEARARDRCSPLGPLHGVPIGVKDVIDVQGMPTGMGSPIWAKFRPFSDAATVAALRQAGAVILGKTVTAEFAGVAPGPTTNPRNRDYTPGGSSSGSAAAVADGMVPLALGTQTGGSIIRPASFCGCVGFKPSFGTVSRTGLKLAAESFDTIGIIARNVDDVELAWRVTVGSEKSALENAHQSDLRLLTFRPHWGNATPDSMYALEEAIQKAREMGAIVEELTVPPDFGEIAGARVVINAYERAHSLLWEKDHHASDISQVMLKVIERGGATSYEQYVSALRVAKKWRAWFDDASDGYNGLLTLAVNGEAPVGLASTGDSVFQEIWSFLHVPTITVPWLNTSAGLPIGVQVVGRHLEDGSLLDLARWIGR